MKHGLTKGRSIAGVLTASLYIACRESGQPWRIREIAKVSNITLKEISRTCRMLLKRLDLKVLQIDPLKCINIIANRRNLSEKTKRKAVRLMKEVVKSKICAGKDPMGLAASVLYMPSLETGETITQKELARTAGVTEVTIRNRYKDLTANLELFHTKQKIVRLQ